MASAKRRFEEEKCNSWPVADRDYLQGVVSSHQIEAASPAPATPRELLKSSGKYPYVHSDHPLSYALERMRAKGVDVVPVVSRANIHQIYGVVALKDILAAYGVGDGSAGKT
jgi:CBS domain-containing protein